MTKLAYTVEILREVYRTDLERRIVYADSPEQAASIASSFARSVAPWDDLGATQGDETAEAWRIGAVEPSDALDFSFCAVIGDEDEDDEAATTAAASFLAEVAQ